MCINRLNDEESQPQKTLHIQEQCFIECLICYQEVKQEDSSQLDCGHIYCKECLCGFLKFEVTQSGKAHMLKCPDKDCKEVINQEVLMGLVNNETFNKYLEF